ncbi:hypothetical protein [Mesorhizobium sp.]|uniref:hypothetical protein n=1 Tax=Mesorhizobium sp. TaxID=1871066 RepID=UPI001205BEA2|nr:hypothetical protein [Mesorhizobium sp.]TIM06372.1 MAG: hypothetical protein E5Y62_24320 [Mesorhizobium sp.]
MVADARAGTLPGVKSLPSGFGFSVTDQRAALAAMGHTASTFASRMADACPKRGDHNSAGFYHALGQDLLGKAANALADLMAIGVQQTGMVRH